MSEIDWLPQVIPSLLGGGIFGDLTKESVENVQTLGESMSFILVTTTNLFNSKHIYLIHKPTRTVLMNFSSHNIYNSGVYTNRVVVLNDQRLKIIATDEIECVCDDDGDDDDITPISKKCNAGPGRSTEKIIELPGEFWHLSMNCLSSANMPQELSELIIVYSHPYQE